MKYEEIELENMTVEDLKYGLGDVMGEYDTLFYCADGKLLKNGMKLLSDESKEECMELSKGIGGIIILYVYHLPKGLFDDWDDDETEGERDDRDHETVEKGRDERETQTGEKGRDERETETVEKVRDEREVDEEENERNVIESDSDRDCSDEEFNEIRKATKAQRKKIAQEEQDFLNEYGDEDEYDEEDSGDETDEDSGEESDINYVMSEEEEEDAFVCYAEPPERKKRDMPPGVFNSKTPAKNIKWKVGMIFVDKKQLKTAVRDNSMASGRPYKYLIDDKRRVQLGCAEGCPFKMWVSYIKECDGWQIKTVVNEHNCVWNYKNKLVTVKYLVDTYGDRIRKNPNWKLGEMQDEFKRVLKVDVCEAKCCRVRQKALSAVEEKMKEHYANMRRFAGELLKSNTNNTVKLMTTRLQEGDEARFQRIYICYDSLSKAWKNECRPVLGLDGCFLKTVCGGQLLSAVGRDGNNCILPVAMAVVESECYDSWKWFLDHLIDDLDLGGGQGKTIISDQQKVIFTTFSFNICVLRTV